MAAMLAHLLSFFAAHPEFQVSTQLVEDYVNKNKA